MTQAEMEKLAEILVQTHKRQLENNSSETAIQDV